MQLIEKIAEIKEALKGIENSLNEIGEENFEEKFYYIRETINRTQSIREELKKEFTDNELKKYNPEMDIQIKQIRKMFDSVVREKIVERDAAGIKLKNTLNQKKIASYIR